VHGLLLGVYGAGVCGILCYSRLITLITLANSP